MSTVDLTFARAACVLGKSESELRAMATPILASILHNCLEQRPKIVWTISWIEDQNLVIEVNFPPHMKGIKP